jgi:2-oxoglutarate dehydrogenase E2 component (dihydrolipoamide succinyltransferase)
MAMEIKVPMLPESIAEAIVLDWLKRVGDEVQQDDILVELETDKVVLEIPAPRDGRLIEVRVGTGDAVTNDDVIAIFEPATSSKSKVSQAKFIREPDLVATLSPVAPLPISATELTLAVDQESATPDEDVRQEAHRIPGVTGDTPSVVHPLPVARENIDANGERREPMSRLRQTISTRLLEAQHGAAILTTFNEVDLGAVIKLRKHFKEPFEDKYGVRLGFMSFFVKASVEALEDFPVINARIDGKDIVYHDDMDIGIAVSSPRGLVVPVLRNVAQKSISDIEKEITTFGEKAKNSRLTVEELTGGTFTITNGGVFGSLMSTPILNPPQSAILGMHKIEDRPVAVEGEVEIRPMMYLALSYDHRLIDGREAVGFLVKVKSVLEEPTRLLLNI